MRRRLLEPADRLFLLLDQGIEPRNLDSIVPLLVGTKSEQIRVVLRSPSIKEQFILAIDDPPQLLGLVHIGPSGDLDTVFPIDGRPCLDAAPINLELERPFRQSFDRDRQSVCVVTLQGKLIPGGAQRIPPAIASTWSTAAPMLDSVRPSAPSSIRGARRDDSGASGASICLAARR